MKTIGIQTPCSEDWTKMTPSEKGAFCQKCAKHVHDFSNKSINEIKSTLLELSNQTVCVRMTTSQEDALNAEFKAWISQKKRNPQQLFIAALLIVFGLTLFSCEDERDQQRIESVQQIAYNIASDQADKMELAPVTDSVIALPPPPEILVEENYIMGAYEVSFVQAPPPEPEVEIEPEIMVGGIGPVYYGTFLEETTTNVELDENGDPYPTEFKALAFPNPAVETTTLEIQAPEKERMDIRLYDASGKFIREIHSGKIARGTFRQVIDLNDLNSGLYLIIIQSKAFRETVRVVKNG
ncbi:T9SS type A sorting domain-containing protein [Fluviicola sp.]|uniref:T9SS type A sorting domain-containing protein n=1 Tax=Fluviicola sp. TaxID=1917219 RepID=UPI0031D50F91